MGMQDIEALHPLVAANDIGGRVALGMANMESGPGRIRKHVESVKLRIFAARLARIGGAKRAVFGPMALPGGFEDGKRKLLADLHGESRSVNYTRSLMGKEKRSASPPRNSHKAQEMAPVLGDLWVVKCSADYPEMDAHEVIEETGDTFQANAAIKAVATSQIVFRLCAGR